MWCNSCVSLPDILDQNNIFPAHIIIIIIINETH